MIGSKVASGVIGVAATVAAAWLCLNVPESLADESASPPANVSPPINASGKGMTNAQLEETRPVLSGLKSVDEAYRTVKAIRDNSQEIVRLCTNKTPVQTLGDNDPGPVITGPFTKTSGKYYTASKWKLRDMVKGIDRQKVSLCELLSQNRQDRRLLRASEETRKKIESLRAQARERLGPMTENTNKLTSTISSSSSSQDAIVSSAKDLIRSCRSVEESLREMEKVLKRETKS